MNCTRKTKSWNSHGMSGTKIHRAWTAMKQRCTNKNNPNYKYYGARGIGYCKSWEGFIPFLNDMGTPCDASFELDRIDNELGYSKDNCRWISGSINSYNRRVHCPNSLHRGIRKFKDRYQARIFKDGKEYCIGRFDTENEAIDRKSVV